MQAGAPGLVRRSDPCSAGGYLATAQSLSHFSFDIQIDMSYSIGMTNRERPKADVLQGTLDVMVLQTLAALGALHGYAIAARLEQVSSGVVRLNMGTLYPALMRMEQRGFVRGEWDVTESNRKARFYAITADGRRELAKQKVEWDRTVSIMRAVLREQG
jgi:PadR family transcriptional regulator, regulatory protein PadR